MKNMFLGVTFLLCLGIFVGVVMLRSALAPLDPSSISEVTVIVPKGASITAIGTLLTEKGLIRSPYLFRYIVWKDSLARQIQAGSFTVKKSQTVQGIATTLTKGTNDVWITILEGWRNEELADALRESLGDQFDSAEFLRLAKPQQGYLFPDTYLFPRQITPQGVVDLMRRTFDKKITQNMTDVLQTQGRTEKDAVILASILEREARTPETLQIVSGILLKRLAKGWPLQADATLQYVKGYSTTEKSWWVEPLAEDKNLKSPYNTYLNLGLPPTPIGNPGLEAIKAAFFPKDSPYWFYISDSQGVMHYAVTLEEHNANVQKYLK